MCVGFTGMSKGSLEKIISDMVRRLDSVRAEDGTAPEHSSDPLQEMEAFMPVDPVLASLHKEYLDANARHKKLAHENGLDDPMTDVASDMLDSARSALQTRLIELQESREQEVSDALASSLRRRRAEREVQQARADIEKRRKEERDSDVFFWFAVMYWIMGQTFKATTKRLSAANDFALVSVNDDKRAAWA